MGEGEELAAGPEKVKKNIKRMVLFFINLTKQTISIVFSVVFTSIGCASATAVHVRHELLGKVLGVRRGPGGVAVQGVVPSSGRGLLLLRQLLRRSCHGRSSCHSGSSMDGRGHLLLGLFADQLGSLGRLGVLAAVEFATDVEVT